jgi:hypothetical protein
LLDRMPWAGLDQESDGQPHFARDDERRRFCGLIESGWRLLRAGPVTR